MAIHALDGRTDCDRLIRSRKAVVHSCVISSSCVVLSDDAAVAETPVEVSAEAPGGSDRDLCFQNSTSGITR